MNGVPWSAVPAVVWFIILFSVPWFIRPDLRLAMTDIVASVTYSLLACVAYIFTRIRKEGSHER